MECWNDRVLEDLRTIYEYPLLLNLIDQSVIPSVVEG